jgi:tRNA-modifying protein YgfZ
MSDAKSQSPSVQALPDRGVVAVTGPDARSWLDNLITNDLTRLDEHGLVFAGLLTPQGKILFEFFVYQGTLGLLVETTSENVLKLIKRLSLYKLRAKLTIADATADWRVEWGSRQSGTMPSAAHPDPRAPRDLWRRLVSATDVLAEPAPGAYAAERVRLGIAEAPDDFALGDAFPHEANYDRANGVSFTKGCYVGQEVVARMQNKAVVRKRVVRVSAPDGRALASGEDIQAGPATIGRIGTVAGADGLAMVRLDRALEAEESSIAITAGNGPLKIDDQALTDFVRAQASRPVSEL